MASPSANWPDPLNFLKLFSPVLSLSHCCWQQLSYSALAPTLEDMSKENVIWSISQLNSQHLRRDPYQLLPPHSGISFPKRWGRPPLSWTSEMWLKPCLEGTKDYAIVGLFDAMRALPQSLLTNFTRVKWPSWNFLVSLKFVYFIIFKILILN